MSIMIVYFIIYISIEDIDKGEFYQLIKKIDTGAEKIDSDTLFDFIDDNKNGKIDINEFRNKFNTC